MAALASEADFVFIPEDPAVANWPEKLCKKLEQVHFQNNRFPLDLVLNILLWVFNGDRFLDFDFYQAPVDVHTIKDLSVVAVAKYITVD